jgi:NTP pyrophosphatase (non-canonical NTP hydrolase)
MNIPDNHYNLIYLMEECGEVTQACSKIIRFGLDTKRKNKDQSNKELLEEELGDVLCLINRLMDAGIIDQSAVERAAGAKAKKLAQWEKASKNKDT